MRKVGQSLLDVLQGRRPNRRPVWLMRQAGRYLPEYRDLRSTAGSFLNLCLTPEWATEVTLQPVRRFDVDGAILFADILLIPRALGLNLVFKEGEGPQLPGLANNRDLATLRYNDGLMDPIYETLRRIKPQLPASTTLIGFCGAPWTVACYMIDGRNRENFREARAWVSTQPEMLQKLISILIDASESYLSSQIEAGAEVLQIFDSWAGLLHGEDFVKWVIEPTRELVQRVKQKYPEIPIIGFPREARHHYGRYVRETGVDALSLDPSIDRDEAVRDLQKIRPLQGNVDPEILVRGGSDLRNDLDDVMKKFGSRHIVNLGHGVVPQTPPEHVAEMVKYVHDYSVED